MAEAGAGWLSRLGPLLWAAAVAAGSVWCWPPVCSALGLADLPTSPAARPDGSLAAAVGSAAIWTEAAWDGQWHSPSRRAPACAMRVPACSLPLVVGKGFRAEALCRGPFHPLGREGRLPPAPPLCLLSPRPVPALMQPPRVSKMEAAINCFSVHPPALLLPLGPLPG